jgi:glycosyltransferase involved in cell wall biosynthesis
MTSPHVLVVGPYERGPEHERNAALLRALSRVAVVDEIRLPAALVGAPAWSRPAASRRVRTNVAAALRAARVTGETDLVVVPDPWPWPVALLRTMFRAPVWIDVRGLAPCVDADIVSTTSPAMAELLSSRGGIPRDRCTVLPDTVTDVASAPITTPSTSPRRIVAFGGEQGGGVDVLIEALRERTDFALTLVGGDSDERQRALRLRGTRLVDADVAPRERRRHLDDATIVAGLLGSGAIVDASFPLHAIRAMAAGRAVVTASTPTSRAFVRDGDDALLVRPADAASVHAGLDGLVREPERARQLGAAARATFERRFAPDVFAARVASIVAMATGHDCGTAPPAQSQPNNREAFAVVVAAIASNDTPRSAASRSAVRTT